MTNFASLYERLFLALSMASALQLFLRVGDAQNASGSTATNIAVYVITLVAFLIGNSSYLSASYGLGTPKLSKLIGDAALLITQGACFAALARSVFDPGNFNLALIVLAFSDLVWLAFDPLSRPIGGGPVDAPAVDAKHYFYPPRVWIAINTSFGLVLIIVRLAVADQASLSAYTAVVAIGNRLADFLWTRFGYRPGW